MATKKTAARKHPAKTTAQMDVAIHRRILNFLNEAIQPGDLVYEKLSPPNPEMEHEHEEGEIHEINQQELKPERRKILDPETATEIIAFRDREYPLGFRNVAEALKLKTLDSGALDLLLYNFSNLFYGSWSIFPQNIPRRGPGGYDGVVHAALLHTGKVLFITADETTLLWNPDDTSPATFEDPVNQPHLTPDAASGYSVLCGGHSFLSDGRLLVVGGGGYGPHAKAIWGYKFDPTSKTWTRTTGSMVHHRWYPTVLTLGDGRIGDSHEVLVVCGHGGGDMEIYDESTDSFRQVTLGDDKPFPNLYPGLHLLPDHSIFYTRTGWGSALRDRLNPLRAIGGSDEQSAYFAFTASDTGNWNDIAPFLPSMPDRTKGMSVLLLSNTAPQARIMVLGGSDAMNNNSYEIIDASALSTTTNWGTSTPFPDGEHRSLASAVLLPDGTVFVCGGIQRTNSPCALFNPRTNSWSAMAVLPFIRDYHSVALLLPSGQVAMAGWNNTTIEIFNPPYLYRGARPVISAAPATVQRGQKFEIASPDAATIDRMALVRPMAVTHQTDTEQKILDVPYVQKNFSTFGTISTSGAVTDRFGVGHNFDALAFVGDDLGYGPKLFYYLRHDSNGFSTFGTISTSGAVTDRFGVGNHFDALTFWDDDLGYGPNLFYYLRHDSSGFSTFGTISTSGAITDRFGVGNNFHALTVAEDDLGYGRNLFYYLRRDSSGFSTFGTISTSGAVTDRFGVGNNFDALRFVPANQGYGSKLFYYLRHDGTGFSTFGTISTSGAVTDRFGVGNNFNALTFAPGNQGYGPKLFYFLRQDAIGLTLTAPDGAVPHSLAPQGYYMLFAINKTGVPSVAKWVYLD